MGEGSGEVSILIGGPKGSSRVAKSRQSARELRARPGPSRRE